MSPIKEPHYFSTDIDYRQVRTEKGYLKLFRGATAAHSAVGEASTSYLHSDVAVNRLIRMYPGSRIVVCLRNPVDMVYSLHGQALFSGTENIEDFVTAWKAHGAARYGPVCSLGTQLERLYGIVPPEQVQLVFLEDMKREPRRVYKAVLDFLRVPDDYRVDFPVANAASKRRWPNIHKAVVQISRMKAKLGLPPLGSKTWNRISRLPSQRSSLSGSMREQIVNYFHDEIDRVETITHRNLQHWRQ